MPKSHVFRLDAAKFQADILRWYDKNRRVLPWRATGSKKPDPYKVWLSEIMLQQTTVPAVIPYFQKFTQMWANVDALASAKDEDVMAAWAGLGYYARARNLLKCARVVSHDLGGKFPKTVEGLLELPGIGPYTAAAIAAIAYGQGATVVDGNIERIVARVFAIDEPLPKGKADIRHSADIIFAGIEDMGKERVMAYPQALMDIGADICAPKSPKCHICPVETYCQAHKNGAADSYPVRAPKKIVPVRQGRVYWIENELGQVLFEKRADNRMLGGMRGLPTTDWDIKKADDGRHIPLLDGLWGAESLGHVYHVFTHFKLELEVWVVVAQGNKIMLELGAEFLDVESVDNMGLPTVFLKAARFARKSFMKVK